MSLMNSVDRRYKLGFSHPKVEFPASNLAELIRDTIAATTGADAEVPETTSSASHEYHYETAHITRDTAW
jgi:hypothetical protein